MKLSTLAKDLKPYIVPWIQAAVSVIETQAGTGTAGGGLEAHALDGAYHTGTLGDSQAPQFLKTDGSRGLTGNLSVSAGVTIDTVDISAHAANATAGWIHHAEATAGDGIDLAGQQVAVDVTDIIDTSYGLTEYNNDIRIKLGENSGLGFGGGALALGAPSTLTAATTNSVTTGTHAHAVTATADGAANHGTLLKSGAVGDLELDTLRATLLGSAAPSAHVTLQPAGTLVMDPLGDLVSYAAEIESKSSGFADDALAITGWRLWNTGTRHQLSIGGIKADELYVRQFIADGVRVDLGEEVWSKSRGIVAEDFLQPSLDEAIDVWFEDVAGMSSAAQIFSAGDWLQFRTIDWGTGLVVQTTWYQVVSYLEAHATEEWQKWRIRRRSGGTWGKPIKRGAVCVDWGASGQGYMYLSALRQDGGPFIQSAYWSGDNPHTAGNRKLTARVGNLTGTFDYASSHIYGFAAAKDLSATLEKDFDGIAIDPTNGLRLLNAGLKIFNGAAQTVDMTKTGSVRFGSNIGSAATTGFAFTASTGDLRVGVSGGHELLWSQNAGTLKLKGAMEIIAPSTFGGSGYLQVGAGVKDSTLNGWNIDSTEIVGQASGVDQVVMGTNGKITAGAGAVMLDADGLALVYDTNWPTREIDSVCWYDSPTARTLLTARIGSYYGSGSKFSRLWVGAEAPTGGSSEVFLAAQVNSAVATSLLVSSNTDKITLNAGTTVVNEALTVGTTLGVTGATTLSSTLGVSGATTLSSTLDVTGATTLDYVYLNADDTVTSNPPTAGTKGGWKLGLYGDTYAIGLATYTLAVRMGGSGWFSLFNNVNPSTTAATATAPNPNAFYACNATYQYYAGELGEDWTNASLAGVWTAYSSSYHTPGYKKFGDIVMLRGLLATSSTNGNGTVIFTLPAGYRPTKSVILSVRTNDGSSGGMSHVKIASDGTLNFTGDATGWCSLEGLFFSISAA